MHYQRVTVEMSPNQCSMGGLSTTEGGRVTLGRLASLFVLAILISSLRVLPALCQTPNEPVPPGRQELRWRELLVKFSSEKGEPEEGVRRAFFEEDVDAMPPEWRFAFISARLRWCQVHGDWETMVAIHDRLMVTEGAIPKRPEQDADLLCQIAGYYLNVTFFPPGGRRPDRSEGEVLSYWQQHYRDPAEAERIYRYIVDHFDARYVTTLTALRNLAFSQENRGEGSASLENFRRAMAVDFGSLHGASRIEAGGGEPTLVPASTHLRRELKSEGIARAMLPSEMTKCAALISDKQTALTEFERLAKEYKDNPDVQAAVEAGIHRVLGVAGGPPPVPPMPSAVADRVPPEWRMQGSAAAAAARHTTSASTTDQQRTPPLPNSASAHEVPGQRRSQLIFVVSVACAVAILVATVFLWVTVRGYQMKQRSR